MKIILSLTIFFVSTIVYGQSEAISGNFEKTHNNDQGIISYKLILNSDSTFIFYYYGKIYDRLPQESNKYGKGTWKSEKNLVYFYADHETDFDEKYTLDFSNTKARFITKSPRDKSDRVIKTSILFYESDISWIERWNLIKLE